MDHRRTRGAAIAAALALAAPTVLGAQSGMSGSDLRAVVGGNVAVGAVAAGVRAALAGKPIGRALLTGAAGGLVHASGKLVLPRAGLAGAALGALGSSVVANAGRGAPALDEVVVPVGPLRVRASGVRRVNLSINVYETASLATRLLQPGVRADWERSGTSGTMVLRSSRPLLASGARRAAGITEGTVILMSDHASDPQQSFYHERVHVLQAWFVDESVGRPIERAVRARTPGLRLLPHWLDLGVVPLMLSRAERITFGDRAPMRLGREAEADALEPLAR